MIDKEEKYLIQKKNKFSPSEDGGKILVTGGTGFLGSYIIKLLIDKGYAVKAIRRSSKVPFWIPSEIFDSTSSGSLEWIDGDVLDVVALEDAMEGVDTIIHSAAIVSFAKKDRKKMYKVNVDGTANVVNVALEKNVRRLIHISSVAALGRTADGGHVNEEKKWEESKVNTHYAISKFKAELHAWRGFNEGLEGVILNPSTILGFGDWNTSSCAIFKKVYAGFKWYTSGINGFVDVEDVAKATILLLESNLTEQRYIINGDSWTFKKLQETIADGFNIKRPTKQAASFLMGLAWRVEKLKSFFTGKPPLLSKESASVAQSQTWFENDKLLKAFPDFGFTSLDVSIKNACAKYIVHEKK